MILDTFARVVTLLFFLAGCVYAARVALRLDNQIPDGYGVKLTREQQDVKDAMHVLTVIAVALGLAFIAFGLWWLSNAAEAAR